MGLRRILRNQYHKRFSPVAYLTRLAIKETRRRVQNGPFCGMAYVERSFGSAYVPKLLGIYEREIASVLEEVIAERFDLLVDIGAAEGYFAVGMAMRMGKTVTAYETDREARQLVGELARYNGVGQLLDVQAKCEPKLLAGRLSCSGKKFVLCDIEGYESELLDPLQVPQLTDTHILVELHEFNRPGITAELMRRFQKSHHLKLIWQTERRFEDFPYRNKITRFFKRRHFLKVVSEMRPCCQSWLWMKPLSAQAGRESLDVDPSRAA